MSHYTTVHTEFKDVNCLVDSLCEMKNRKGMQFTKDMIQVSPNQTMYGYDGRERKINGQKVTGDVRIGRKHVGGAANDLGLKESDGTYTAIISGYDKSHYNSKWMGKLKQTYASKKTEKLLKK